MAGCKERVNPESSSLEGSYAVEYRGRLLEALSPVRVVANEGTDCSVMVGVRVRPFSEREKRLGAKLAVQVNSNETSITASGGTVHRFLYDYSFWSCDSHMTSFASQEVVYTSLAQPLLDWSFEGYNTCIFAYGQTGSGKSYSIMGEGAEVGIVPRFSQELFDRVEWSAHQQITYKVEISYYEVYNERIHDLLASNRRRGKIQLRVREHPVLGPYVEDLSTYVVTSFADIEHWLAIGNKFRATAATGMNDKSSRSHSVFTIMLTQSSQEEGEEMSKVSRINLIDLAGSERSSVAMTSGERLKEGSSINRSLHTLGKVIALLAERSSGKRKKVYVPYRDSTLTWLLKDSLGGNSKTAMIATISPADIHYDESLSTLRYAHQARSIVNIARVNEDPASSLIRELRREIDQLRSQLHGQSSSVSALVDTSSSAEVLTLKIQLQESERLVAEASRTWKERLDQAERRKQEEVDRLKRAGVSFKVDNRLPNLVNLNEDPQLSEMLLYIINEGTTVIGQKSPSSEHEIQLTGALVAMNHCVLTNEAGTVSISPSDESAQTYVNGNLIIDSTVLHHGDRVVVGGDHYFRFNHPTEVAERGRISRSTSSASIKDFEFARNELIEAQQSKLEAEVEQARQKEREKMMDELQQVKQALDCEKASYSTQMEEMELELRRRAEMNEEKEETQRKAQSKVHQLEEKNKQLEEETALQRQVIHLEKLRAQKEQEELHSYRARVLAELGDEKRRLESHIAEIQEGRGESDSTTDLDTSLKDERLLRGSELLHISMMVQEANSISKTLGKNITFLRDYSQSTAAESEIGFRVTDAKKGVSVFWDLPKLEERLYQMRELYQAYLDGDSPTATCPEDDPFFHPLDGWEEAESRITSSGIALLRKFPHLQVPAHVRDQLIAAVSPSGSPVLKHCQGGVGDNQGLARGQPPPCRGHMQGGGGLTMYWREKLAESSGRPISPLLATTSSPFLRNDTPSSDISRLEDGLEPPPPVAKLCLSRMAALTEEVKGLRHRQCRTMTVAVLYNMAKLSTAMSVLAETADNYCKLSKSGEVQVALHETTDVEACSLSICSSLELLVQSLTHLQLEQEYVQHTLSLLTSDQAVEGRAATAAEKVLERLMDGREEVMERVVQMLQAVCSGDEEAFFTSQDSFTLSVEHLGQLVGSLSLARRVLAGPSKGEGLPYCIQDEELWGEGLPYSTVKSYFCGVMVFCQEQLAQTAHSMQHEASSGILADESGVGKSTTELLETVAAFLEALAAHQTSLWEDLLHHVDDGTLPSLPQCSSILDVLQKMATVEASILTLCESSKGCQTRQTPPISQVMDPFTQLATASLSMVRSAQCSAEVAITADLQALSRDTMQACRALKAALKARAQAGEVREQGQQQLGEVRPQRQSLQELLNDSSSGFAV